MQYMFSCRSYDIKSYVGRSIIAMIFLRLNWVEFGNVSLLKLVGDIFLRRESKRINTPTISHHASHPCVALLKTSAECKLLGNRKAQPSMSICTHPCVTMKTVCIPSKWFYEALGPSHEGRDEDKQTKTKTPCSKEWLK